MSHNNLIRLATYLAVSTAMLLIAVKFAAWLFTGSVSILSTLVDSVLDMLTSLVNLLAVRHALTPADKEHRFGHGKAEPLAGLGQSAFIAGSALFVLIEAGAHLYQPQPITHSGWGMVVMVFSILVTLGLVVFQSYVVKQTNSLVIEADSLHYRGDILINVSVIISIALANTLDWYSVDALFGGAIAVYLLINAWRIVKQSLDNLMDRELPDEERANIISIALGHLDVLGVHDLKTRRSGPQTFIQMHLEIEGDIPLFKSHEIADAVEMSILRAYPEAEVIIHQDPHGVPESHQRFK